MKLTRQIIKNHFISANNWFVFCIHVQGIFLIVVFIRVAYKSFLSDSFTSSSTLPSRTIFSISINGLSFCLTASVNSAYFNTFCLTASVNSAYLNKCHNGKLNKCFILSISEKGEKIKFPKTVNG